MAPPRISSSSRAIFCIARAPPWRTGSKRLPLRPVVIASPSCASFQRTSHGLNLLSGITQIHSSQHEIGNRAMSTLSANRTFHLEQQTMGKINQTEN
jgi:hypothetical protein